MHPFDPTESLTIRMAVAADAEALRRYAEHPEHQAGVGLWREFATWVIADYEF